MIVSRQDALTQGLVYFNTGEPCRNGHISKRRVRDRRCLTCETESTKRYARTERGHKLRTEYYHSTKKDRPAYYMLINIKNKAKRLGIPFDLTLEYLEEIWPIDNKCPALGITLESKIGGIKTGQDCSPSLDRIDPKKGYVQGNVAVLSLKANRIKNDATIEELGKIVSWLEGLQSE